MRQRGHQGGEPAGCAHDIGDRGPGLERHAVHARHIHDARHRLDNHVEGGATRVERVCAEAGDRTVDQPRIDAIHFRRRKALAGQRAGPQVFDQDVGGGDHTRQEFASLWLFEV